MMATTVDLTAELECFVRECIETGRFNDASEIVRTALRLLQKAEEQRHQLQSTLPEAETEADRVGITLDRMLFEIDKIIDNGNRN
jgi:antitoxin ParD1/3/4